MFRKLALALMLTTAPGMALAHQCPMLMQQIDAALPNATLSEADMQKVRDLRAKGEAEHQAGNHDASETALNEAKALLGI